MKGTHIYQTKGIFEVCKNDENFYKEVIHSLSRFLVCDWGDTSLADKRLNDQAIKNGNDRIVAKYITSKGDIFIITEVGSTITTILFAYEY